MHNHMSFNVITFQLFIVFCFLKVHESTFKNLCKAVHYRFKLIPAQNRLFLFKTVKSKTWKQEWLPDRYRYIKVTGEKA